MLMLRLMLSQLDCNFMDNLFAFGAHGSYDWGATTSNYCAVSTKVIKEQQSDIKFGNHNKWNTQTNTAGQVLDFVVTNNEEREFTDRHGVKHFRFKNGTEILYQPERLATFTDRDGNQYTADFDENLWKSNDDDDDYIIDAYGDIHKIGRIDDEKIYWIE